MSLSLLIYGPPGSGKTPVALTAPTPHLLIATDSGWRHAVRNPVVWEPSTPIPEFSDDSVVVAVIRSRKDFEAAVEELMTNRFVSVTVDCLDRLQFVLIDSLTSGTGKMERSHWGELLFVLTKQLALMEALLAAPSHPLEVATMVAHVDDSGANLTPSASGKIKETVLSFFDVAGYLQVTSEWDGSTYPTPEDRRLLLAPLGAEARDRTSARSDGGVTGHGIVMHGPIDIKSIITRMES